MHTNLQEKYIIISIYLCDLAMKSVDLQNYILGQFTWAINVTNIVSAFAALMLWDSTKYSFFSQLLPQFSDSNHCDIFSPQIVCQSLKHLCAF